MPKVSGFLYIQVMENDSSLVVLPADSASNTNVAMDTAAPAIQMPTPEQLGIAVSAGVKDASGTVMPITVTVGDTIQFPVTVSWSVQGSALLVVPTGTASAKGLTQVGVSQESARSVKDGKEVASITFNYKIVAQDTGNLSIPVMKFEIPTQMGQSLTLRTESVPVRVDGQVNVLPAIVGGAVAVVVLLAGLWRLKRRAAAKAATAAKNAAVDALREQMQVLKRRINTADCREWLLDLEKVCKAYAADRFGLDADKVKLEVLLKQGDLEGWESLLEKFADARYGGGKRDAFENKETWKAAMKLMGIEEE